MKTQHSYQISADTIRALYSARAEQAKEYRTQLAKPNGLENARELYSPFIGYRGKVAQLRRLGQPAGANVTLINGTTFNVWLPIDRVRAWARACRANSFTLAIIPDYLPSYGAGRVTAFKLTRADGGSVIFYGHADKLPDGTARQLYGDNITLTAPAEGGEFTLSN